MNHLLFALDWKVYVNSQIFSVSYFLWSDWIYSKVYETLFRMEICENLKEVFCSVVFKFKWNFETHNFKQ